MKYGFSSPILLAILLSSFLITIPLNGAEIKVSSLDPAALERAIVKAKEHDVILLQKSGTIHLGDHGPILINKSITITSKNGPLEHIIDGGDATHIFNITGPATQVTISKLSLINGDTDFSGGAISNLNNCDLILENVIFSDNHAVGDGGAVHKIGGKLTITNCLFEKNTAAGNGGAVCAIDTEDVSVNSSGFISNTGDSGGGIRIHGVTASFGDCLFFDNDHTVDGKGGGIYWSGGVVGQEGSDPEFRNLTLIANSVEDNDPVEYRAHIYSDHNTLIVDSIIEGDVDIALQGYGGEVPGVNSSVIFGEWNLTGTVESMQLGPLTDNGGVSRSFSLLPSSPAIDAGSGKYNSGEFDQRRLTRICDGDEIVGSAIDIGAFEVQMYQVSALQIRGSATGGISDTAFGNPYDPSDDADSIASASNFAILSEADKADIGDAVGANNAAGGGVITIADHILSPPNLTTTTLKGRELEVRRDLAIYGPGANLFAVDGGGRSRIITIAEEATLYLSGLAVQDGVETDGGGILLHDGKLFMEESSIHNNIALSAGGGLAIYTGTADISKSSFIGNRAAYDGGAIKGEPRTTLNIINSTLSLNQAGTEGHAISTAGKLSLTFSTLVNNFPGDVAPGILLSGKLEGDPSPEVTLSNSIFLQGATSVKNVDANLSAGYLLSDAEEPALDELLPLPEPGEPEPEPYYDQVSGNTIDTVGELDYYYGGTTMSHAPTTGSLAINRGDDWDHPAEDQPGSIRPVGGAVDIGSVEFLTELPVITIHNIFPGEYVLDTDGNVVINPAKVEYSVNDDNVDPEVDKLTVNWFLDTEEGLIGPLYEIEVTPPLSNGEYSYGEKLPLVQFSFPYLIAQVWDEYAITGNPNTYTTLPVTVPIIDRIPPVIDTVKINDVNDPDSDPIDTLDGTTYKFKIRPGYNHIEMAFSPESLPDDSLGPEPYSLFLVNGDVETPIDSSYIFQFVPNGTPYTIKCVATDKAGNTSEPFIFHVVVTDDYNISWPNALELVLEELEPEEQVPEELVLEEPELDPVTVTMWKFIPQYLALTDQSRWYKFTVSPGSRITAILSNLPANYDVVVYKDIGAEYLRLVELLGGDPDDQQLALFGAEFAPDAFSPDAFSPDAFSPDAFSPDAFSPDAFSPDAFSPDAFSPDAFSPDAFSPDAFSPDAFSPDAFSPDAFSPDAFSPDAFSPDSFSPDAFSPDAFSDEFYTPDAFSPDAFSSAQLSSMVAFSAYPGLSNEGIRINTYTYSGDIYIRVKGSNGAYNTDEPFSLTVYVESGICDNVESPSEGWGLHPAISSHPDVIAEPNKSYETIILWDSDRMGIDSTGSDLENALKAFSNLPEIKGIVINLADDNRVFLANEQAKLNPSCPYAKNNVADEIKAVIDIWDEEYPLEYVVLVGNDDVIPFFRIADESYLANEDNYVPPVRDDTPSQASLRNGLVLTQDPYGSKCEINLATGPYSIPNLAVGRLIESADDVIGQLQNYMTNPGGVLPIPDTALVTGYDFLVDVATNIETEFSTAIGSQPEGLVDSLISEGPTTVWDATDLADNLLGTHHDLVFLAGHFSTGSALAADFKTRLTAKQVLDSRANLLNTLIFSVGCHSGYNTVDDHAVTGITLQPDWAQAFAKLGATLIAGTGYQYGDTEFIEYSERLYLEFARQLRTGSGEVAIGHALNKAKRKYLAETPIMRGIHEKSLVQATLFGLPMLKINVAGARITETDSVTSDITLSELSTTGGPGASFGLQTAVFPINPILLEKVDINMDLVPPIYIGDVLQEDIDVSYFKSINPENANLIGFISNPSEPVRPLESRVVTVPGTLLRGVGFWGGVYTEDLSFVPMTGAPSTEERSVYANFYSDVFFPIKPYSVNFLGAICGGTEGERLNAYPTQFISNINSETGIAGVGGTLRKYSKMDFKLFYNDEATVALLKENPKVVPALLSSPPSIANVYSKLVEGAEGDVEFEVNVLGMPTAGIQEVWITYTGGGIPEDPDLPEDAHSWRSLDLIQESDIGDDTTLWKLTMSGVTDPQNLRFIVQAATGTGLVAMSTNQGRYFAVGQNNQEIGTPTKIEIQLLDPTTGEILEPVTPIPTTYGETKLVRAKLYKETSTGWEALDGKLVGIRMESSTSIRLTETDGTIELNLPINVRPGLADLQVFFAGEFGGDESYERCSTSIQLDVSKRDTKLEFDLPESLPVKLYPEQVRVQLTDDDEIDETDDKPIPERTVYFLVEYVDEDEGLGNFSTSVITDINGYADMGNIYLPAGKADITAYFNGLIPLPDGETVTLEDEVYISTSAGLEGVTLQPPDMENSLGLYPDQADVYYKSSPDYVGKVYEGASIAGTVEFNVPLTKDDLMAGMSDPYLIECQVEAYLAGEENKIADGSVWLDTRGSDTNNWTTASRPGKEISFVNIHWNDAGDGSPIVSGDIVVRLSAIDGEEPTPRPPSEDETNPDANLFEIRLKLGSDDSIQVRSVTRVGEGLYATPWSSEDPGHKQYRP